MTDLELNTAIAALLGDDDRPGIPPYATDLNRAVAAGQALGMFDYDVSIDIQCGRKGNSGAWVVHSWEYNDGVVEYETIETLGEDFDHPARAVCNAIIAFTQLKAAKKIIGDGDHAWLQ